MADFVFRRIGKPKQGGWYEANKQFIAPLPVPNAAPKERRAVAERARALQEGWTRRRELLGEAADRLSVLARARHPAGWLWPDLPDLAEMTDRAPKGIRLPSERRKWAEAALPELEAKREEALGAALGRGGRRDIRFERGELQLVVGGEPALQRIFLDGDAGRLAESYWRWLLLSGSSRDGKSFAANLRRPPAASTTPAAAQFVERVADLAAAVADIEVAEKEMNELLYGLYRLTPDERILVENERARRGGTSMAGPIG